MGETCELAMKDFLFIGGCPRSGTSLLSALIGNLPGVGVVQDLCLLHYLKQAALNVMFSLDGESHDIVSILSYAHGPRFDLRGSEFFPAFLNASLEECLNQKESVNGLILREFFVVMDKFLFYDFNKPDPRKDRGAGASYLQHLDLARLFACPTIADVCVEILVSSAQPLGDAPSEKVSLVCEKTPENTAALDVIDFVMAEKGFRYLHLVRDPVSVFGARRQRFDDGVNGFCVFFETYSETSFESQHCLAKAPIRYEDILVNPQATLKKAFDNLSLSSYVREFSGFESGINPGKYVSYVGTAVDSGRDLRNREMVSLEEQSYIYETLAPFCEKYSYGPYSIL